MPTDRNSVYQTNRLLLSKKSHRLSMIKKSTIILFFLLILFSCVIVFIFVSLNKQKSIQKNIPAQAASKKTEKIKLYLLGKPIDILNIPLKDYIFLTEDDKNQIVYIKNNMHRKVVYNQYSVLSINKSPSEKQIAFFSYPNNNSTENIKLIIHNIDLNIQREIYSSPSSSWDVRSNLHWLGNSHIFFMRHCGSSCQGITLINVVTKEIKTASLSYPSTLKDKQETHFKDWYGNIFIISGLVGTISSKEQNNKSYLIMQIQNKDNQIMRKEEFLFTDDSLVRLL